MIFDEESASDAEKFLGLPKHGILEQKIDTNIFLKKIAKFFGGDVEKSNAGNRLKRIFPKFPADRSHVRGVNGHSKFEKQPFLLFWRRKL